MTRHYPDLGSASDWIKQIFSRGTTNQKHYPDLVVIRHQYGISVLVPQTSFRGKTSGGVGKGRLFFQPTKFYVWNLNFNTFSLMCKGTVSFQSGNFNVRGDE